MPHRGMAPGRRWPPCDLRVGLLPAQAARMVVHPAPWLAETVLAAHLAVIAFNVLGLVVIPLGGWLGWRFVRVAWWRWPHLALIALVAAQALAGRACILTVLEDQLAGAGTAGPPLIMGFVNRMIFWPLPLWAFAAAYVSVFFYVVGLLWLVPIERRPRGVRRR